MTIGRDAGRRVPGVNMTPMIDVVFLMIIFFMLVAELSRARAIDVDPPRQTGIEATNDGTLLLQLDSQADPARVLAGDRWYALDDPGLDALAGRLAGLDRVRLRADRDARYAAPSLVLDVIRDAGVTMVELVVEGDE